MKEMTIEERMDYAAKSRVLRWKLARALCDITEKSVDSTGDRHKDSRIDIYVEVRLRLQKNDRLVRTLPIVIENKIDSKEHDNKTESYYKWANDYVGSSGNGFIKPLCVFLTRQRTLTLNGVGNYGDVPCSCEKYIRINYRYIVDHLLEQCLKQDLSEDVRRILKDYIRSLTYTYIKGDINEGGSYMAIGKEKRELLARFWDNNKNLLGAVLVAVTQDTDGDMTDEDRRNVEKAVASLSKRDYTKYSVEGYDEVFAKNRMVLAVVQKYCREYSDMTYDKLKAAFPNKLQGSFGVVMREDERRGKLDGPVKRYFEGENERIPLSDGSVMYVSSEWGKDNIPAFIRRAKELGITVTIVPTKS